MTARLESFVRALPTLVLLLLLVLGGWLAARWFWYFATPSETPAAPARSRVLLGAAAQTVADAHLFGVAASGVGGETMSNLSIKLKGVFASGSDAPAFAILNSGGKDDTARPGSEVVPGVVLESVHPQYVMLRRNGTLERVNLEERAPGGAAAAGTPSAAAPRASRNVPMAPPSPPPTRPSRPEPYAPVGDVAAPPAPPPAASQPTTPEVMASPRGLVIQTVPPGSALERLGLQPGDVIRSVNGESVTSEADIARIIQQRGIQGSYTAEVTRGGTTVPIAVGGAR